MAQQLALIERSELEWHLDDKTRQIGRRGLEEARRALRAHARDRGGRPPSRPRAA
jgi:hypothetical protein